MRWRSPPERSDIGRLPSSAAPTLSSAASTSAQARARSHRPAPVRAGRRSDQKFARAKPDLRVDPALLGHVADMAAAAPGRSSEHRHAAGSGREQAENGTHDRRLSRAVRSEDACEAAPGEIERHVVQDAAATIVERDVVESDGAQRQVPRTGGVPVARAGRTACGKRGRAERLRVTAGTAHATPAEDYVITLPLAAARERVNSGPSPAGQRTAPQAAPPSAAEAVSA